MTGQIRSRWPVPASGRAPVENLRTLGGLMKALPAAPAHLRTGTAVHAGASGMRGACWVTSLPSYLYGLPRAGTG